MGSYLFLAVRALMVVVIAAAVWPFLADAYDGLVAGAAGAFAPEEIELRAANGWVCLDFLSEASGTGLNVHGFVLHFGLILALALVAATPSFNLAKLTLGLVGTAGLFLALHVVGLLLFVWGIWWAIQGEGLGVTTGGIMAAFAIFWALLPAVIGGAWCYQYWLPALKSPGEKATEADEPALKSRSG